MLKDFNIILHLLLISIAVCCISWGHRSISTFILDLLNVSKRRSVFLALGVDEPVSKGKWRHISCCWLCFVTVGMYCNLACVWPALIIKGNCLGSRELIFKEWSFKRFWACFYLALWYDSCCWDPPTSCVLYGFTFRAKIVHPQLLYHL